MRFTMIVGLCFLAASQAPDAIAQTAGTGGVFEAKFRHNPSTPALPFASALVEELHFSLAKTTTSSQIDDCAEGDTENPAMGVIGPDCGFAEMSPVTEIGSSFNDRSDALGPDRDTDIAICGDIVPGREGSCLFGLLDDNVQSLVQRPDDKLYGPDGTPVVTERAGKSMASVAVASDMEVVSPISPTADQAVVDSAAMMGPSTEITVAITIPEPEKVTFLDNTGRDDPCAATSVAPGYRCINRGGFPRIEPEADNREVADANRRLMAEMWVNTCGSWSGVMGMSCYVDRFGRRSILGEPMVGATVAQSAPEDPCLAVALAPGTECIPDGRGGHRIINEEQRREEERKLREELWTASCGAVDPAPGYSCVLDVFYAAVIVPIDVQQFAASVTGSDDARFFSGKRSTAASSAWRAGQVKNWRLHILIKIYNIYNKVEEKVLEPVGKFLTALEIFNYLNGIIFQPRSEEEVYWTNQYREYWDRVIQGLDARRLPRVGHLSEVEERTLQGINKARLEEMSLRIASLRLPVDEGNQRTGVESEEKKSDLPDDPPDPVQRRLNRIHEIQQENPSWNPSPGIFDTSPEALSKFEKVA